MSQALPLSFLDGVVYPDDERHAKYVSDEILGQETLADALQESLRKNADRVAIGTPDGTVLYSELDIRSDRLALALSSIGLNPLDRVLFQLPNSVDLIVSLVACWKANLVPVCTLQAHREAEIGFLGELSEARAIIVPEASSKFDHPEFARRMASKIPSLQHIIISGGRDDMSIASLEDGAEPDAAAKFVSSVRYDPFQVCVFQLSGGTTGIPKLIPRFSSEYVLNMRLVADVCELNPTDAVFMPLPIIHNAGMACVVFPALLEGAEVVLTPSLDPTDVIRTLMTRRPTQAGAAGPMLARMKAAGISKMVDLSRLRRVISMNAARLSEETLGGTGMHIYGMSEGLIMLTPPSQPSQSRYTSVGWPVSEHDEVRILRPGSEEPVTDGEVGELVVRGPYTLRGYYKSPERNKEAFTTDGYYRSGDLVSRRHDGVRHVYTFEGRIKDVVDRGGEKINCEEVERIARTMDAIADIAIVPVSDPDFGERACAFVVPHPGQMVDVPKLSGFLKEQGLAKFKWPERVEVVDNFPVTKAGKLDKKALRTRVEAMP